MCSLTEDKVWKSCSAAHSHRRAGEKRHWAQVDWAPRSQLNLRPSFVPPRTSPSFYCTPHRPSSFSPFSPPSFLPRSLIPGLTRRVVFVFPSANSRDWSTFSSQFPLSLMPVCSQLFSILQLQSISQQCLRHIAGNTRKPEADRSVYRYTPARSLNAL